MPERDLNPPERETIGVCTCCGEEIQAGEQPYGCPEELCVACYQRCVRDPENELKEQWLEARKNGLGASDAACVLGLNPWKTNVQLWQEKTGTTGSGIVENPAIQYGKAAEAPLRELFALDFPQYRVDYDEYGMISQPDRPWLFATLDGTLTDTETQAQGVLEIKTTEILNSAEWKKWDNRVPNHYYTQVLHQLLATGFSFAILKAQIRWRKGGDLQVSTRHYRFDRADGQTDMDYLLEKETAFWALVQERKRPALILPEI